LQALEQGVKGGLWYSLLDKIYKPANLRAAFAKVKANRGAAGVDHVTLAMFEQKLESNLEHLHEALKTGTYQPQAVKRVWIPKLGSSEKRPLGIPTVRDRVVQTALRNVLEPIFERELAEHSYGYRPGKSTHDALRRVDALLKDGYTFVVDADIKGFFDTIPHDRLMELLRRKVADGKVLSLIESYLQQPIQDNEIVQIPLMGTPQGSVISPLLANLYLNSLDHGMAEREYEMVRYADDFVILTRTAEKAQKALALVADWMGRAGLTLHPTKTRIVNMMDFEGFDFIGYHFQLSRKQPGRVLKWPRKKSIQKLKDTIRAHTRRANGHALATIIEKLNPVLRGHFNFFKQSVANVWPRLDGWIRMRLRAILQKNLKLKGRGRGTAHNKWPNDFFHEAGLFSTVRARELVLQPAWR
jgi:RNA-directed DNA polymerase